MNGVSLIRSTFPFIWEIADLLPCSYSLIQSAWDAPPGLIKQVAAEVEIRFLICQDKPARQFEFWLDISRIWLDKFSGPIMIIIIMKGTKVLTFSASNLERMTHVSQLIITSETLWLSHNACMVHLSMTWPLKKAWQSCDLVFSMMLHAAVATFYCLDIMSAQSEFWPDKCGKWPEIGQWPAAISSSGLH